MINPLKYLNTRNFKLQLSDSDEPDAYQVDELKKLVHRKLLLENLIRYGRKLYPTAHVYIVNHDDISVFCYKISDWNAQRELENLNIPFLN